MLKDINSGSTILTPEEQKQHAEAAALYGIDLSKPISENQHLQLLAHGWAETHGEEAVTKLLAAALEVDLPSPDEPVASKPVLSVLPGGKKEPE